MIATAKPQVEVGAADFTLVNLKRGSESLNEMKADIDFAFNTVLGVFKPSDCEGHHKGSIYTFVRFETERPGFERSEDEIMEPETLEWHGFLSGEEFEMYVWDGSVPVYSNELGASAIPMAYVAEIRDGVDIFLAHMASDYPAVVERCRPLLLAAIRRA